MIYTLFQQMKALVSQVDSDSPSFTAEVEAISESGANNCLYTKAMTIELDAAETRTLVLANFTLAEWTSVVAHVYGEAKVTTTAMDTDDSTPIVMDAVGYGTTHHPGIIMLSTYNVSGYVIEGLAADTKVVLWLSVLAKDDDARLTSNA